MLTVQPSSIPVVIFAGGYGSRLGETTDRLPKPLVPVAEIPIIDHVISRWKLSGFSNFIVLGGYKVDALYRYFHDRCDVSVVDTGLDTQTGGRLLKIRDMLPTRFCASYGDGITTHNLGELLHNHCRNGVSASMLVTHPISRFGHVIFDEDGIVTRFDEKPINAEWINAGFFVFEPDVFDYIYSDADVLETHVFTRLVEKSQIRIEKCDSWWHCMDTPKDVKTLEEIYHSRGEKWQ